MLYKLKLPMFKSELRKAEERLTTTLEYSVSRRETIQIVQEYLANMLELEKRDKEKNRVEGRTIYPKARQSYKDRSEIKIELDLLGE